MSDTPTHITVREPSSRSAYQPRKRTRHIYLRKVKACAEQLLLPFQPIALSLVICHKAAAHYTHRFVEHLLKHFRFLYLHRLGERILSLYNLQTKLLKKLHPA